MQPIEIWSDIHCPWALIAVHRLRRARANLAAEVSFVPRAWPLEWVNGRGTPRAIVTAETAVLASHEPDLFNAYRNDSWPSTFLPAFELVAADFEHSRQLPIEGSPQIFWPDGSTTHNPGMTDHYWRGGLMRINSTNPGEPERLLRRFVA